MSRRVLAVALLSATLAGCAVLRPPPANCVKIGPRGVACLLDPASLPAIEASHIITVIHDDERQMFLGRLKIDSGMLHLGASSLFGAGLFTISYDGEHLISQPASPALDPKLIIALLEMSIADPSALQDKLHHLTLDVQHVEGHDVRMLKSDGRLAVRIERSDGPLDAARIKIEIPRANTTLLMEPVQ